MINLPEDNAEAFAIILAFAYNPDHCQVCWDGVMREGILNDLNDSDEKEEREKIECKATMMRTAQAYVAAKKLDMTNEVTHLKNDLVQAMIRQGTTVELLSYIVDNTLDGDKLRTWSLENLVTPVMRPGRTNNDWDSKSVYEEFRTSSLEHALIVMDAMTKHIHSAKYRNAIAEELKGAAEEQKKRKRMTASVIVD